eukprot:5409707-Amphidinium_carterae.1
MSKTNRIPQEVRVNSPRLQQPVFCRISSMRLKTKSLCRDSNYCFLRGFPVEIQVRIYLSTSLSTCGKSHFLATAPQTNVHMNIHAHPIAANHQLQGWSTFYTKVLAVKDEVPTHKP